MGTSVSYHGVKGKQIVEGWVTVSQQTDRYLQSLFFFRAFWPLPAHTSELLARDGKSVNQLTCLTAFHVSERSILFNFKIVYSLISKLSEKTWRLFTITVNLQSLNNQGWRKFWRFPAQTLSQSKVSYGAGRGCSGFCPVGSWNPSRAETSQPLCTTCPSA